MQRKSVSDFANNIKPFLSDTLLVFFTTKTCWQKILKKEPENVFQIKIFKTIYEKTKHTISAREKVATSNEVDNFNLPGFHPFLQKLNVFI